MKTLVANLSGNVGKSTLARHLVAEMRPGTRMLSIESINSDAGAVNGAEVTELAASRFKDIYYAVMSEDEIVVDVGASNIAEFMAEVQRFRSMVPEFDRVIVPTVPAEKQQQDTIATLEWLLERGVKADKINVVFNRFDVGSLQPVSSAYPTLVAYLEDTKKFKWKPEIIVATNEVYENIKHLGGTLATVANDSTDFKAARQAARGDVSKLDEVIGRQMAHDLAATALENLREAHAQLFGVTETRATIVAAKK